MYLVYGLSSECAGGYDMAELSALVRGLLCIGYYTSFDGWSSIGQVMAADWTVVPTGSVCVQMLQL